MTTELHIAAKNGDLSKVHQFVKGKLFTKPIPINTLDSEHQTPLYLAALGGHEKIVHYLIKEGATVNPLEHWHPNPLSIIVRTGHQRLLYYFIGECKAKLYDTILIDAAHCGHFEIIPFLVRSGASVNAIEESKFSSKYGNTTLHYAIEKQEHEIARFLMVEGNANVNCTNQAGQTPLHLAASYNDVILARLLVKNGTKINALDNTLLSRQATKLKFPSPRYSNKNQTAEREHTLLETMSMTVERLDSLEAIVYPSQPPKLKRSSSMKGQSTPKIQLYPDSPLRSANSGESLKEAQKLKYKEERSKLFN